MPQGSLEPGEGWMLFQPWYRKPSPEDLILESLDPGLQLLSGSKENSLVLSIEYGRIPHGGSGDGMN